VKVVNIAKDFSKYPAGRNKADGPYCGELFRETHLEPSMQDNKELTIKLDGTRGYGSSFLEEAFGGLVRAGHTPVKIKKLITIISSDSSLKEEIFEYIDEGGD